MKIGDKVRVKSGANADLKRRGWIDDYMTQDIDGMHGTIVGDHGEVVVCKHVSVDLGFSEPVGITPDWLELI